MTTLSVPRKLVEQQFVFEDVPWGFYQQVLRRVGDQHIFVTYDRGRLEVMSPSWKHDRYAEILAILVRILAEELRIPLIGGGSTTFKRRDLKRGLEPDRCFYIRNAGRVRGKRELDLSIDPPPDLAIEVEISTRLLSRVSIYEALGVPELWRSDGIRLRVLHLAASGKYEPVDRSPSFPQVSLAQIVKLADMAWEMDDTAWARRVRAWIRKNIKR